MKFTMTPETIRSHDIAQLLAQNLKPGQVTRYIDPDTKRTFEVKELTKEALQQDINPFKEIKLRGSMTNYNEEDRKASGQIDGYEQLCNEIQAIDDRLRMNLNDLKKSDQLASKKSESEPQKELTVSEKLQILPRLIQHIATISDKYGLTHIPRITAWDIIQECKTRNDFNYVESISEEMFSKVASALPIDCMEQHEKTALLKIFQDVVIEALKGERRKNA